MLYCICIWSFITTFIYIWYMFDVLNKGQCKQVVISMIYVVMSFTVFIDSFLRLFSVTKTGLW